MNDAELFRNALIDVLKTHRKASGLSHERLAEKAGVTRQTIGKIESGLTNPTTLNIWKISNAMGISLSELVKEIEKRLEAV